MAWRFQPSKFKNTTPKIPKKEDIVFDLPVGALSCTNNGVQCSNKFLAFHIEGEGGKLGVLPAEARGRRIRTDIEVICAHADQVDDFSFLPYEEEKLVTCSRDEKIKVWSLEGASGRPSLIREIDAGESRYISCLRPHPTATALVAAASTSSVVVADIEKSDLIIQCNGLEEKALSVDWSGDGRLLAVSADKGKQGLLWDPRACAAPIKSLQLHGGMGREARCLFTQDAFISTGFTNKRIQELRVFDARSWDKPLHVQEYTATTGVLIPLYDPDTKLLFLAGKGTNKINIVEMQQRQPIVSHVFELSSPEQLLGFALAPKATVRPIDGEVARVYQLTKHSIVPIPCIVPRRSYRELHVDLFPDTRGPIAACSGKEWLEGCNDQPEKISLIGSASNATESPPPQEPIPTIEKSKPMFKAPETSFEAPKPVLEASKPTSAPSSAFVAFSVNGKLMECSNESAEGHKRETSLSFSADDAAKKENVNSDQQVNMPEPTQLDKRVDMTTASAKAEENATPVEIRRRNAVNENSRSQRVRPKSCVVGQVQSKYRHVDTLFGIKAGGVFTNLRNVNTRLPVECNGAVISNKYAAIPLAGPAGIIAIIELKKPVKMPDGVVDGIYNKAQVTDFSWSPFEEDLLAVGTDQGTVNLWRIPSLSEEPEEEKEGEERREEKEGEETPRRLADLSPQNVLRVGGEKIVSIRWHPLASDVLAIGVADGAIEVWNTEGPSSSRKLRLHSHQTPILSFSWSTDGQRIASIGKDLELHVCLPLDEPEAIEGRSCAAVESPRAARVFFCCDDSIICLIGFTKSSGRQIRLFDSISLNLLHEQHIDNAVQPLIPYYDFDSSVLFLSGKGDRTIQMFELCPEDPFLLPLAPFTAPSGHQSIAFHHKFMCDVKEVKFQRAWRLTEKTLEPVKFLVPRVKKDLFQTDLFPEALVTWKAAVTASDWLAGSQAPPNFVSLRPEGMPALAVNNLVEATPKMARRRNNQVAEQVKETIPKEPSWSRPLPEEDGKLEQDSMEGVHEEEWKE